MLINGIIKVLLAGKEGRGGRKREGAWCDGGRTGGGNGGHMAGE